MNWTETRTRLIECGIDADRLPEKRQPGINLRGAYLSWANLTRADLREANLSGANLYGANLTRADLREANLTRANLRRADLREANLSGANLYGANLTRADLSGADLRWANLTGASGPFTTGYFGRHHAVAAGGYISIGCERHNYVEWLEQYEVIGAANKYTAEEIADYGAWIKIAVARQRRIEEAQS